MKFSSATRSVAFTVLLSLTAVGATFAQSADPSATIAPSKPAAETATPSPGAAVNSSPATKDQTEAAPEKPQRSAEEKKARKAERLHRYDLNKDGKLDKTERAAMRADKGLAPQGDKAKVSPTP